VVSAKTWLAIPIMAVACAGLTLALGRSSIEAPHVAIAIGALAAAAAACVRAFAGPSLAAAMTASAAAALAVLAVLDTTDIDVARAALAGAAALFAIAELARPLPVDASPLPAIGGAVVACALDPSYVALPLLAGTRLVLGPWARPRWSIVVPLAGTLAIGLALLAAAAERGIFAELWVAWAGQPRGTPALDLLVQAGDTLGPIATVAALAGLVVCALRGRYAAAASLVVAATAIAVALSLGTLGAAPLVVAALAAGVGLARLAATVRWPTGQTFVGATAGFLIVVAPAVLQFSS
jgi:hypothetical protein